MAAPIAEQCVVTVGPCNGYGWVDLARDIRVDSTPRSIMGQVYKRSVVARNVEYKIHLPSERGQHRE